MHQAPIRPWTLNRCLACCRHARVVAHLASLQGQEREIGIQIEMWKNAKDAKKRLDEEVLICENILKDKDSRSF